VSGNLRLVFPGLSGWKKLTGTNVKCPLLMRLFKNGAEARLLFDEKDSVPGKESFPGALTLILD